MTEAREVLDRELAVLTATVQGVLKRHEEQMERINRHMFYGNGKESLDVQLSKVQESVKEMLHRHERWNMWFWTLVAGCLIALAAGVLGWWIPLQR